MDVHKSATDAGYIAVGLGVMGFQQAQVRRRQVQAQIRSAGDCVAGRAQQVQDRVTSKGRDLDSRAREATSKARGATNRARGRAEETVTQTVSRVQDLATEVTTRVEPVVVQVSSSVAELPERVAQAIEPMAALVRERFTRAA
jgi:cytoskeletal protein RodZ